MGAQKVSTNDPIRRQIEGISDKGATSRRLSTTGPNAYQWNHSTVDPSARRVPAKRSFYNAGDRSIFGLPCEDCRHKSPSSAFFASLVAPCLCGGRIQVAICVLVAPVGAGRYQIGSNVALGCDLATKGSPRNGVGGWRESFISFRWLRVRAVTIRRLGRHMQYMEGTL